MAVLGQTLRGISSILLRFRVEATSALVVQTRTYRSPYDTKARRARELRPRRNYLLNEEVEHHREPTLEEDAQVEEPSAELPLNFRNAMPEFLPNPNPLHRDRVKESLERMDMYRRRACIDIPEFYVGSIMAVRMADQYSPGKHSRFVGICIHRGGDGLRSNFTLRNVIDGQGVEVLFDIYSSTLHKIEVLKLEKRLDEELFYLRDAPPQYSTVPFDFEPVPFPKGAAVPVNNIKVKLNSRPWLQRWERLNLKGVEDLGLPERFYKRAQEVAKPWEKYDIMKQHRESIDKEEEQLIMKQVYSQTFSTRRVRSRQKASSNKD